MMRTSGLVVALVALALAACQSSHAAPPPAIRGAQGALDLLTLDGQRTNLAAHGTEVTVVALWATWCGPCVEELPKLEALRLAYAQDPRVSIVAVSIDDPANRAHVQDVVSGLHIGLPVLIDDRAAVTQRFLAADVSVPQTFYIDRAFHVLHDDGFEENQSTADFVAAKRALIDRALAGSFTDHMPPIEHAHAKFTLDDMASHVKGGGASIHFGDMDEPALKAFAPQLRKMFKDARPHATEKELDRLVEDAEANIRAGKAVELTGEGESP